MNRRTLIQRIAGMAAGVALGLGLTRKSAAEPTGQTTYCDANGQWHTIAGCHVNPPGAAPVEAESAHNHIADWSAGWDEIDEELQRRAREHDNAKDDALFDAGWHRDGFGHWRHGTDPGYYKTADEIPRKLCTLTVPALAILVTEHE